MADSRTSQSPQLHDQLLIINLFLYRYSMGSVALENSDYYITKADLMTVPNLPTAEITNILQYCIPRRISQLPGSQLPG